MLSIWTFSVVDFVRHLNVDSVSLASCLNGDILSD